MMAYRPDDGGSKNLWHVGKLLHGATTQRTAIFILAAVRTWNLTYDDRSPPSKHIFSECDGVHFLQDIFLLSFRISLRAFVNIVMNLRLPYKVENYLSGVLFSKTNLCMYSTSKQIAQVFTDLNALFRIVRSETNSTGVYRFKCSV
jgi:hypothetical protein